jgi:hypothetical protein
MPKAALLVIVHNRTCLRVEGSKSLAEGLHVVVGTLDERFTGNIIHHGFLWGAARTTCKSAWKLNIMGNALELLMICPAACGVYQPARDAGDE